MKTKKIIFLLSVMLFVLIGFGIISSNTGKNNTTLQSSPPTDRPNEFLIGAYDMKWDQLFYQHRDALKFNTWHNYEWVDLTTYNNVTRYYPFGWGIFNSNCQSDLLYNDILAYSQQVKGVINNNKNHGFWSLIQRPKIMWIYSGQSSKYQCEQVLASDNYESFYAFNYHSPAGADVVDNGILARKFTVDPSENLEGLVISNVKVKNEQCALVGQNGLYWDKYYKWFIKPRIKIPQGLGNNVKVCSIKIINCNGEEKLNEILYAFDFKNSSGVYDGLYKEKYRPSQSDFLTLDGTALAVSPNLGYFDIQIYWFNECDMWIDYVKIENEVADKLFNENPQLNFDNWIEWEANNIGGEQGAFRLNVDEPDYNMLPCVKYIQDRILSQNYNISLIVNEYSYQMDPSQNRFLDYDIYKKKLNDAHLQEVLTASYPMRDKMAIPNTIQLESYNPNLGILGTRVDENVYENTLQDTLDKVFIKWSENGLRFAKEYNKTLYFVTQVHQYKTGGILALREPTNEEIQVMTDIAISYGAKGIFYYCYNSWNEFSNSDYCRGLTSHLNNHTPLYNNVYGQPKWNYICALDDKISKWGPTLMSLPIANTWSHSYCVDTARSSLLYYSYFNGITTFKSGSGIPQCVEDNIPSGLTYDCPYETYLQVATMKNTEPNTEYFMIVNRRCFVDPRDTDPHKFGARFVRVRFDANSPSFQGFNNWTIINVEDNSVVGTFDKRNYSSVDLSIENSDKNGWFKPGEGRLYKIVPTIVGGGTLVSDESIQGVNITCNNLVTATDKNINIGFGTTINFTQNARLEFTGGTFTCGDVNQPSHEKNIIFQSPLDWNGITLNSCNLVNINSAKFEKVKGELQNTNYALKLFDCFTININNCTFTNYPSQKSGAIESNYNSTATTEPNIYIAGNLFDMNSSDKRALSIMSFASGNVPVRIYNNNFSSSSNSETAIYLSFVTGVAICDNIITGFNKGVELIETNIDFYNNVITSISGNNLARGVDATVNSTVNMSSNGNYITGGRNTFDNTNSYAVNIYVNNSIFLLDYGKNNFKIMPYTNSLHLSGYFPGEGTDAVQYERKNCFKLNNSLISEPNLPHKDVKWATNNNDVEFEFFPYECAGNSSNTDIVIDAGNYVYDTIQYISGGTGGGFKEMQITTPKTIYDSVCILMRLRNYSLAKAKCNELLNLFPDSLQSLNSISKLYQLSVVHDTSLVSANNFKTFLNTLILNHPNNLQIVRKCNYYIQKCKVRLKEYQSAMTGFQQIIQQNPYTYEALLASWDYAATNLLDSLNGHSGGVSNINSEEQIVNELIIPSGAEREDFINDYFEKMDNRLFNDDDKDIFTKEERKTITTSVITALDDSKKKVKDKIEILTKKSEKGESNAKIELKVMKTINEVVRIRRPKTVFEHINLVNNDLQKLNTVKNDAVKKETNIIPDNYSLSQNYPNPFNPVTKINYELPKDGKVKLVIYDILGREMKTLVNNEFKTAGRYTVEFNGTQFASGVYFYRIQVEGGKGFTAVKKMVLVK